MAGPRPGPNLFSLFDCQLDVDGPGLFALQDGLEASHKTLFQLGLKAPKQKAEMGILTVTHRIGHQPAAF